MTRNLWQHLVRSLFVLKPARGSSSLRSGKRALKNSFRPNLECLEYRLAPAMVKPPPPPMVSVSGPATDQEGTAVSFTGNITDGENAGYHYDWQAVASNGQKITDLAGSISDKANLPSFTFTPDDDGTYTVSLTVTDEFGGTGQQSAVMTATNVAPTATITGMTQPNKLFVLPGDVLSFSGAFTDPGTADGHTVKWDFADGNSSSSSYGPGGSATFNVNHAFASAGTYIVTLSVTDDDNGLGTSQITVVVQSPADATGALIGYVPTLTNLNHGQQNALISTLNAAIDALNRGDNKAAVNQLDAFENKVSAFGKAGILTQDQVNVLLSSADSIEIEIG